MRRIFPAIKRLTPLRAFGIFLAVVAVVVAALYVVNQSLVAAQQQRTDASWSLIARPISADDHLIGNSSAPIEIIAYSSLACRYCAQFFETQVPRLQAAFGDKIVIAYRHNPIPQLPSAAIQEPASECVYQLGGSDAFWRFAKLLFPASDEPRAAEVPYLATLASQAGVSATGFSACMQAGQGEARVKQDRQEAAIAGMTIDPSILLKSPHRALVLFGDSYSQIYASIQYLLSAEAQYKTNN